MIHALFLLALATSPSSSPSAADLESSAFQAVKAGRWCEANDLFLQAHALGPAAELLANASLASSYAGDRAGAMRLLDAALSGAAAEKIADYRQRRAALAAELKTKGPGTACPTTAPETTTETPGTTPETTSETTTTTTPEAGKTPEAPPTTAREAVDPEGAFPVWFAVAGGGAALGVAGAVVATVGALPFFAHEGARQALLQAQADKVDDDSLVAAQAQARADWEGYGQAAVVVGSVMVGVGVVAIAGVVVMGLGE